MPQSGMFLTQKEVEHLGYFLRSVWYSVEIPNHPLNKTDRRALAEFMRLFEAVRRTDGDEEKPWPWYWTGADKGVYDDDA